MGGALAVIAVGGVGYGVYKMVFDARQYLEEQTRDKAPWEREPGELT